MATVVVTEKNGELVLSERRTALRPKKKDTMRMHNKTKASIYWSVPEGPFVGGRVDVRVNKGKKSGARKAAAHDESTEYAYQVSKTRSRVRKRGPKSDPIIIIDVDR